MFAGGGIQDVKEKNIECMKRYNIKQHLVIQLQFQNLQVFLKGLNIKTNQNGKGVFFLRVTILKSTN